MEWKSNAIYRWSWNAATGRPWTKKDNAFGGWQGNGKLQARENSLNPKSSLFEMTFDQHVKEKLRNANEPQPGSYSLLRHN